MKKSLVYFYTLLLEPSFVDLVPLVQKETMASVKKKRRAKIALHKRKKRRRRDRHKKK